MASSSSGCGWQISTDKSMKSSTVHETCWQWPHTIVDASCELNARLTKLAGCASFSPYPCGGQQLSAAIEGRCALLCPNLLVYSIPWDESHKREPTSSRGLLRPALALTALSSSVVRPSSSSLSSSWLSSSFPPCITHNDQLCAHPSLLCSRFPDRRHEQRQFSSQSP